MVLPSAVTQLLSTCTEPSVCAKYLARVLATHLALVKPLLKELALGLVSQQLLDVLTS